MLLDKVEQGTPWGSYTLYSLTNNNNIQVDISDLGASIVNFFVLDQFNHKRNIVLGYDTPEQYLSGTAYIGGIVGPWANRIENGHFSINGQSVQLDKNEGSNHLHGGSCELHKRRWNVELVAKQGITLSTRIEEGEGGFPATIEIFVTYRLSDNDELSISYAASVDKETPLNFTHHAYFNLNGGSHDVLDHSVAIDSDCFWDVDKHSIPVGCESVEDTEMNFLLPKRIHTGFFSDGRYVSQSGGYDHCWCLNGKGFRPVSWVFENKTGIAIEVHTDQIGMQFYTGNKLAGEQVRGGKVLPNHAGLCLETQHYPNQINMDAYAEDCIYSPNKPYNHKTVYQVIVQRS